MQTIMRVKFGSHLYGTNTPESDVDYKSIHIPNSKDILLQRVQDSIKIGPDKAPGAKNNPGDIDDESFSLQRYFKLLAEGQTGQLDMLFAPKEMLIVDSVWWDLIQLNRSRLLCKKSASFLGYCRQQANKYGIKGSRVAAARAASELFSVWLPPYQSPFLKVGDIQSELKYLVDANPDHCSIVEQAIGSSGQLGLFFDCCGRKVAFTAPIKQAAEIYTRIWENYGDRARKAESNEGVDWKALSHAVRVGYEAIELLTEHKITFPLPKADFIRSIKLGLYPYDHVSEKIEELMLRVDRAADMSDLPDEVDQEFIDGFVESMYAKSVKGDL